MGRYLKPSSRGAYGTAYGGAAMRTAILLRAVNLGNHKKISMPALKQLLEQHGYADVSTYLQSGNVLVSGPVKAAEIEKIIESGFGLDVDVITRSHDELREIVNGNPFPEHVDEPSKLAVAFCDKATTASIDKDAYAPDEIIIKGKNIYIWYPNGLGRSKIGASFGKRLSVLMTVRNWNTVVKLLALTE